MQGVRHRGRGVDDTVRIGIIGLGEVAHVHLAALPIVAGAQLVAVCDARSGVVEKVAQQTGARGYVDAAAMVGDGGLDLVMILTPAATHRMLVELVARAGIDVFCEKPIAVNLEDAKAIVEVCDQTGIRCFYGSTYRYLPAVRSARELIKNGAIGKAQLMSEIVVSGHGLEGYVPLPFSHYPEGGPGGPGMSLIDHGVHLVDIFGWLLDEKPQSIIGHGLKSGQPAGTEFLIANYPSGAIGHLLYNNATFPTSLPNEGIFAGGAGWGNDGQYVPAGGWINDPGSISVWGTSGSLRIFHYANALFMNTGKGSQRVETPGLAPPGHFSAQLTACVQTIREGGMPAVTARDGLVALSVVLAAGDADKGIDPFG
ncbi:Gfo/Idh/MocA family protein [Mesorhizobium shangrilense]|uniref:Gfo/Idh/MocA family oxidoreductase n=1 Tax=Mesorhizobium shangrilense TaxID=460060 RepID=A0ABV2DM62_9HYPH